MTYRLFEHVVRDHADLTELIEKSYAKQNGQGLERIDVDQT